jgi:hypothetical protein
VQIDLLVPAFLLWKLVEIDLSASQHFLLWKLTIYLVPAFLLWKSIACFPAFL